MSRTDPDGEADAGETAYPTMLAVRAGVLSPAVDQGELNARGLFVLDCLDEPLAMQLVDRSREPHITEYCPHDATTRFNSLERVRAWQAKGRLAVPLVQFNEPGACSLAGFGWMGPASPGDRRAESAGATTTFAIRIYKAALDQGNALPYVRAILTAHRAEYGEDGGIWLEAWADNASAVKTYERAGFSLVGRVPSVRHGRPVQRVYMRLA